jgi:hypothetical protein
VIKILLELCSISTRTLETFFHPGFEEKTFYIMREAIDKVTWQEPMGRAEVEQHQQQFEALSPTITNKFCKQPE